MINNVQLTKVNNNLNVKKIENIVPNHPITNENNNQDNTSQKIRKTTQHIFQVSHKKEIIPNSLKNSQNYIKCIYCGSQYYNVYRFEAHIRIHVSIIIYLIKLINLDR